eukprot:6401717-Karenia_brevis.AAC.1
MSSFLKTRMTEDELETHGGHLFQLVMGKADDIYSEFIGVLMDPRWYVIADSLDPSDVHFFTHLLVKQLLYHITAFGR